MKIAYFAPIYFDYLKQRPQHFAELLSKHHEVFYIEPTISFMRYVLKGGRSYKGIEYQLNPRLKVIRAGGGLTVHKSLDYFDVFNLNSISEYIQLEKMVELCDILWVGYPGWYNVISRFRNKKIVYDKMDEDSEIATNYFLKKNLKVKEKRLIEQSDLIFVSCQKFYDQINQNKRKVVLLRNGVPEKVESITTGLQTKIWKESEKKRFGLESRKKIFGYVGTIGHWFDFDILDLILQANDENEIVLVGNNVMPEVKNERIHYIESVDKEKVPEIIAQFDVCLYNFKQNKLLDTINPVKIYEYLAMNKPVLAVDSIEIRQFGDKLMCYQSIAEVKKILSRKLEKPFSSDEERKEFIKSNSWECRVEQIETEINTL